MVGKSGNVYPVQNDFWTKAKKYGTTTTSNKHHIQRLFIIPFLYVLIWMVGYIHKSYVLCARVLCYTRFSFDSKYYILRQKKPKKFLFLIFGGTTSVNQNLWIVSKKSRLEKCGAEPLIMRTATHLLLWNKKLFFDRCFISFCERTLSSFSSYSRIYQTIFLAIYHSTIVNKLCRRIIYPLIDARHIFAFYFLFIRFLLGCRVLSGRNNRNFSFFLFSFSLFFCAFFLLLFLYLFSVWKIVWRRRKKNLLTFPQKYQVYWFVEVNFRKVLLYQLYVG